MLAAGFISKHASEKVVSVSDHVLPVLNVLDSETFACVCGSFLKIWLNCIEVYTDGSLKDAGLAKVTSGAAVYFPAIDMGIGIRVQGLLSFTLAELQVITLALEADKLAVQATPFPFSLPVGIQEHFLVAENTTVLGNACHFVHDLYQSICHACWKAGFGYDVVLSAMIREINWMIACGCQKKIIQHELSWGAVLAVWGDE
ncbi:hypothetical protein G9A89_005640, partial [Geosiphon pyriformis]